MEVRSEVHPEAPQEIEKKECIICLDEAEIEWRELECHHGYHKQCIENWIIINARCPLCMKDINEKIQGPINANVIDEMYNKATIRFVIFMCFIFAVIIIMVLCSS
jgi:hypothetical protein